MKAADAIRLLQTNKGQYAAACAMDYKRPLLFYDTFAMRDLEGRRTIAVLYPFFPDGETRNQLLAQQTQVELKSCWNGMGKLNQIIYPLIQSLSTPRLFKTRLPH